MKNSKEKQISEIKKINTEEYLDVIKELVYDGKEVSLLIAGNSMSPFLANERDTILVSPIRQPLKKGDMAFYQRETGKYVMHRICAVRKSKESGKEEYYFVGDAQSEIEGPIWREQIFGIITKVCRKGTWITKKNFWWKFFQYVWIRMIPLRRPIRILYAGTIGKFKQVIRDRRFRNM